MQYDPEDKEFIYNQMLERASAEIKKGQGAILDGTFHREASREPFRNLAREYGIPVKWVEVTAKEAVIRDRVSDQRPHSEADFGVYQKIRQDFEPIGDKVLVLHSDTEDLQTMIGKTLEFLKS
jgi:predicted kinase